MDGVVQQRIKMQSAGLYLARTRLVTRLARLNRTMKTQSSVIYLARTRLVTK